MTAAVVAGLTSVVIVAADSGPWLHPCIDAALGSKSSIEVILVDNASTDGEVERVESRHAEDARIRVLRHDMNFGFGPACNRGAAVARGDVLVFLNPDCVVTPQTIADLRAALRSAPRVGVLGVTVRTPNGSLAKGNRRCEPTLRRMAMSASGLSRWALRWPALGGVEMSASGGGEALETIDAVSGACMTLPRAAFEQLGGFDEAYFLHAEDLDLCHRARDAGLRVAIAPAISVTHLQGSSSRHRPVFVDCHKHRGLWRYFTRFDPAAKNPLLRGVVWSGLWSHFAVRAPWLALRGAWIRRRRP